MQISGAFAATTSSSVIDFTPKIFITVSTLNSLFTLCTSNMSVLLAAAKYICSGNTASDLIVNESAAITLLPTTLLCVYSRSSTAFPRVVACAAVSNIRASSTGALNLACVPIDIVT
ncbi:hypothetical protein Sarmat_00437 [Rickettsiales endosymbiont of Paramecium tredecaurelia]|nr:hypothetical protein [Candidatus Sarmatiella mevalonica]